MMFDAMCRAAEAIGGEFERRMRMASLFVSDRSEPVLPMGMDRLRLIRESLEPGFRLPWMATVIDWGYVAVFISRLGSARANLKEDYNHDLMVDQSIRSDTSTIGVEAGDAFMLAVTAAPSELTAKKSHDGIVRSTSFAEIAFYKPKVGSDGLAMCSSCKTMRVYRHCADSRLDSVVDVEEVVRSHPDSVDHVNRMLDSMRVSWLAAHVRLSDAMKASNWIVSRDSAKRREAFDSPKIPRSHQRRHYIVISDQERRRCFRESVEAAPSEGRDVTPHARRAHYRHIGENDDGTKKYTWVRACWVGSTEAEIKGQKYRVELEL